MAPTTNETAEEEEERVVFNIDSGSGSHDNESYHDEEDDDDDESRSSRSSYDDDDDEEIQRVNKEEIDALAGTNSRRLKSMGIMMGEFEDDDMDFYSDGGGSNACTRCCSRYWYCWFCCTVLGVTLFLMIEGEIEYQKQAAILYGTNGINGARYNGKNNPQCQVYDKQTLQLIEQHMITINDTSAFCIPEKTDDCQCKHPYLPDTPPQSYMTQWNEIATMNLALVDNYVSKHKGAPDVAILGDSITEHFNGLDMGYTGGKWKANKRVFDKLFDRKNGGKVNGVALGVGGDRIQNLLYRLQNGEGAKEFHPRVWWILIGTNDLVDNCNSDTIAVGNFRIVEEIRKAHPGAMIVLNSILPRNENPDDLMTSTYWKTIQEINLKMECYANTANNVEFFNATDLFLFKQGGKTVVNPQLMKDQVHPNAEGSRLWGEAIANRVVELKSLKRHRDHRNHYNKKNNKHKPPPPPNHPNQNSHLGNQGNQQGGGGRPSGGGSGSGAPGGGGGQGGGHGGPGGH